MELATWVVGLAILCLALAVAARDVASSLVAGLVFSVRRPFAVGDLIECGDFVGTVEGFSLRATFARNLDGELVVLPNAQLVATRLIKHDGAFEHRIDLPLRVAYGEDLAQVEHTAREATRGITERRLERDPELYYQRFDDSAIVATLRFWIDVDHHSALAARSEAIKRVKHAFAAAGIAIPFPTRSLDFGVAGGTRLDQILPDDQHWHRARHQAGSHDNGVIESDEIMSATAD